MKLSIQRRIANLERSIPTPRPDFFALVAQRMRVDGVSWETAVQAQVRKLSDSDLDRMIEQIEAKPDHSELGDKPALSPEPVS